MRLSARLLIAGLTVLGAGSVASCSGTAMLADANGATQPRPSSGVVTARVPPGTESRDKIAPTPAPVVPPIDVAGAPRGVQAKAGILVDPATGQVLWAKSANVERPIASITKVMTAYLVIQAGDLGRPIRIPKGVLNYVFQYGATSAGLLPGETLTADQLLYGLLLASGADAAYTLATTYGPGMPAFVAKMNATARELGMLHTHFASPDGLPYPTEFATYSTPADLVILAEAAMRSPVFRSVVDQPFYVLKKGDGHDAHWWSNDNELIGSYSGAVGIKTGFTDAAGHCLLFEAVRGGRTLLGVVLDSPDTGPGAAAQDAAHVLNWGFSLKQGSG